MATANQVLATAAGEIGYSRWSDPAEGTKYGRFWAGKLGQAWLGGNGQSFCDMGVNWCLFQNGMQPFTGGGIYYVPTTVGQARDKGLLVNVRDCRPGDLMVFDWDSEKDGDHIGFVEVNRGDCVQTIEFNTSSASDGNGGTVARRTRAWDVCSYCIRPPYASAQPAPKKGIDEDGIWGSATSLALQKAFGLQYQDGIVSRQNPQHRSILQGCGTGWEFVGVDGEEPGSPLISKLQGIWGCDADGFMGPGTVNAMIRFYKRWSGATVEDGRLDCPSITIKAMQRWVNNGCKF